MRLDWASRSPAADGERGETDKTSINKRYQVNPIQTRVRSNDVTEGARAPIYPPT